MRMNREFVMLSESLKLKDAGFFSIGGWFASEKLDGMRALWLPDTRGMRVGHIPFANLDKDKTGSRDRLATGLWSRYARPIWAPTEWLDCLPKNIALDGELFLGRNRFQDTISIVRQGNPNPEDWKRIEYKIFDSPPFNEVYRDGKIHNGQLKKHLLGIYSWAKETLPFEYPVARQKSFSEVLHELSNLGLTIHEQKKLHWRHSDAVEEVKTLFQSVLDQGGEGLIIRAPHSLWEPIRSKTMLKIKPDNEAEAVIVGFNDGEGKYVGMIGSIIVEGLVNNKKQRFSLSGMVDALRVFDGPLVIGTTVTYLYRDLTTEGLPREARFFRIRNDI